MIFPYDFIDSFSMFFIYAFIGWIIEVIYYGINEGKFINRGFLSGPLCPVYGIGFYAVILLLLPFQDNIAMLFFGSMFITTFVEFWAGFILYKIFNLRWWDYSNYKLNVKGFICLQFSIYWGTACTLALKILHPAVVFILNNLHIWIKVGILSVFGGLLIVDIITTVITIIGFKRKLVILSDVSKEIRNVSDKLGGHIYDGVETVVTKTAPTVENINTYKELYNTHREEEKALAKKHRNEERELLDQLFAKEKGDLKISKESINKKFDQLSHGLKRREHALVRKLAAGKNDAYKLVLSALKKDEE